MSINSRLTSILVIGQRKALYGQGISGSDCARKETDILITSRSGDRKIIKSI